MENIHEVFGIIRFHCRENGEIENSQCQNLLQPLQALYNDILKDFNSISHIISNSVSKRSAWFSGIGTVFKHIFGTLDENDAKSYNDAIQALYNNDKKLADSITKSILISQTAISSMNKSLNEININQAKLNDVIDQLSFSVRNISETVNIISFKTKLSAILNVLQSNLLTISFKVEDLLNSILFVKSNTLHPSILTPNQMYNDIVSNLKIIPKHRDFPVSLDISNIHTLINTADLVCYYLDNKLMFIVKLPLVNLIEYNVYKNIPLPTPHASDKPDSFAMILPHEQFLALSKDKSSYTYLKDLNNCKNIPIETYLCEITDVYTVLNNPPCEIEIITKAVSSLPKNCPYKFLFGDIDIWHKLNNNNWIFVQSKPAKLSIECKNDVYEYTISGTGVLNIPSQCTAFHKSLKLVRKANTSINIPKVSSDFNIINDSCCNLSKFSKLRTDIQASKINNVNLDNLKPIQIASDEIVKDLKSLETPIVNHISFPIISILSIILSSSLIILLICKKGKLSKNLFSKTSKNENPENHSGTELRSQPQLRVE